MPVFSGKLADVFGKIWACFFYTSENTFNHPHIFPFIRTVVHFLC